MELLFASYRTGCPNSGLDLDGFAAFFKKPICKFGGHSGIMAPAEAGRNHDGGGGVLLPTGKPVYY